ncbi:hypothetical protein SteCoe_30485 [Stentor coeruleus]|uniref:Uncharacterized protein n=1 Tax=Stentor coeruleus TaxID=5963 RepID=A0A1R2B3F6_9CILI|nr:hypothetical protein SteCoe_30485 [Stentor coeruleus]
MVDNLQNIHSNGEQIDQKKLFIAVTHEHIKECTTSYCEDCHLEICKECSVLQENNSLLKCEFCNTIQNHPNLNAISNIVSEEIIKRNQILAQKTLELQISKKLIQEKELQYKNFEKITAEKKEKNERLIKKTMELEAKHRLLEEKVEKYNANLVMNTTKANMITADLSRIRMEHEEVQKKIKEFQEMIKEQDEENKKLEEDMENTKKDFEVQKEEIELKKLNETELKKRLSKLQGNIEKVKKENKSLEFHLRVLNDEERIKSGTISVISEKVSLIAGSHLEPKQERSNELSLQMKNQLEEVMKLYQNINSLKKEKQARKAKAAEMTNKNCKCYIQ